MKKARIIKIDYESGVENTEKYYEIRVPIPDDITNNINRLAPLCNVGDFLIIDGKTYRRIRGGFREATAEDMAILLTVMT